MALPPLLRGRLTLPLIVAPMFSISDPGMVVAACNAGAIGCFPTANCRALGDLGSWLEQIQGGLKVGAAPFAANLIMASPRLADDLKTLILHRTEFVITSVGSPGPVIGPLHDAGCKVLADVATVHHARKAAQAGVDGLILLSAGAGGQTGWANGFAFVRAVREFYDGIVVLAGGLSDGVALRAAEVLGCDLGYMGTPFIATSESPVSASYKAMLIESELDDVLLTTAFTGLQSNMLRPSIVKAGLDPNAMPEYAGEMKAAPLFEGRSEESLPRRWTDIWSAGHSVSGIHGTVSIAERIAEIRMQYQSAV